MKSYPNLRRWLIGLTTLVVFAAVLGVLALLNNAAADKPPDKPDAANGNWVMYGGTNQRNLVNTLEKNVPTAWSVEKDKEKNVKWHVALGSKAYGGPIIADGKVFVGTYLEAIPKNFRIVMDLPLVDPSVVVPSLDGQRSVVRRTVYTTGTWKFEGIPEPERDDLIALVRNQRGPIFVAFYTTSISTGSPIGWGTMLQHIGPAQYTHTLSVNAARQAHYLIDIPFEEAR